MEDLDRLTQSARRRGLQIAVAESLTCGAVASAIGAGDAASEWFRGGVVAYQTDVKERVLGVEPGIDPCSAECARQLAAGVRELLKADVAVSVSGVGGPEPEDGHPPGTVYLGWSAADTVGDRLFSFDGSPEEVLSQSIDAAIAMLVELVEGTD